MPGVGRMETRFPKRDTAPVATPRQNWRVVLVRNGGRWPLRRLGVWRTEEERL
ncbi:hypothetical protein VE04_10186, partial [Pseudogymnoascus sp. 24MN13]